jgi:uncharacterized protein YciI
MKKYFVLKLIPNRPDFVQTMTDAEKEIMQQHIGYWRGYMEQGIMLILGPVLDPKGAYGLGIIAVDGEDEVRPLIDNDPASQINTYEYYPMLAAVADK